MGAVVSYNYSYEARCDRTRALERVGGRGTGAIECSSSGVVVVGVVMVCRVIHTMNGNNSVCVKRQGEDVVFCRLQQHCSY